MVLMMHLNKTKEYAKSYESIGKFPKDLRDKEKRLMKELEEEQQKSENLLLNILPDNIAQRLKAGETTIATKHEQVSILFADIVNFTPQSALLNPNELVVILNEVFSIFDDLSTNYNIEKIKTIGDSYFAVGGLNKDPKQSAISLVLMAKEMVRKLHVLNKTIDKMDLRLRIGIHCGDVVTGVIGKHKFAYDLWGSAVNFASRMESTSKPGKIHISENLHKIIKDDFSFIKRKDLKVKGVGNIDSYFVE